jgi:hypothetical protein
VIFFMTDKNRFKIRRISENAMRGLASYSDLYYSNKEKTTREFHEITNLKIEKNQLMYYRMLGAII